MEASLALVERRRRRQAGLQVDAQWAVRAPTASGSPWQGLLRATPCPTIAWIGQILARVMPMPGSPDPLSELSARRLAASAPGGVLPALAGPWGCGGKSDAEVRVGVERGYRRDGHKRPRGSAPSDPRGRERGT